MTKARIGLVGGMLAIAGMVLALPAGAQPGNLLANGQFDLSGAGVEGWLVLSPEFSTFFHYPSPDADDCGESGSGRAFSDPDLNFTTAEYRYCIGPVVPGASYWIGGAILFPTSAVHGKANLTLTFRTGPDCTGSSDSALFAGYATSDVAGWQQVTSGPIVAGAAAQSARLRLLLTQDVGSEPGIEAFFDNLRVTSTDWVFADDFELGVICRWVEGP